MASSDIESQLVPNRSNKQSRRNVCVILSIVLLFVLISVGIFLSVFFFLYKYPPYRKNSDKRKVEINKNPLMDKSPIDFDKPHLNKETPLPEKKQQIDDPLKKKQDLEIPKPVEDKSPVENKPKLPEDKALKVTDKPESPVDQVVKKEEVTKPEGSDVNKSPKEDNPVKDKEEKPKPKVVEEKRVKENLDSPGDKDLKQDKSEEGKKVVKDEGSEKKETKVEHQVVNENNKIPHSDVDTIFKSMRSFVTKKGMKVVPGTFDQCSEGSCEKPDGEHVYEWELKEISQVLENLKTELDLEKEYETVKMHKAFLKKYFSRFKKVEEFQTSFKNYRTNKLKVEEHNKNPNKLYEMELNFFADFSTEQNSMSISYNQASEVVKSGAAKWETDLENQEIHVDWRREGVVQPVINQGECGSCWAVASTDVLNSFRAIKKKDKRRFSYQQILDCVSPKYNCVQGGNQVKALNYIKDKKMCTLDEYPYLRKKEQCSEYKCDTSSEITSVERLNQKIALDFLKKNGPFVTLFYTSIDFMLYKEGIFNGSCKAPSAHSVVVVGHGHDKVLKKDYWIVKNSWGTEWGEEGYFRMLDEASSSPGDSEYYCDFTYHAYGIL